MIEKLKHTIGLAIATIDANTTALKTVELGIEARVMAEFQIERNDIAVQKLKDLLS